MLSDTALQLQTDGWSTPSFNSLSFGSTSPRNAGALGRKRPKVVRIALKHPQRFLALRGTRAVVQLGYRAATFQSDVLCVGAVGGVW